jgi:hypothetical protein
MRRSSMFAQYEWLTIPWTKQPKTRREMLYDIAAALTNICSKSNELTPCDTEDLLELDCQVQDWQLKWVRSRELPITCHRNCSPRSCVCLTEKADGDNAYYTLLKAEFWAVQLQVDCELYKALATLDNSSNSILKLRMRMVAERLDAILSHSIFMQETEMPELMTEGKCRTFLPWATLEKHKTIVVN